MPSPKKVRIAAVADVHCTKTSHDTLHPLFAEMAEKADVLALCGDLTDYGLPDEARVLAKELAAVKAPVVAVLGNHDFESGHDEELRQILCEAGVALLDGESYEVLGVGFAGAKGFAGGFGSRALPSWGEAACKHFVQEAIDEALKLEKALARLSTEQRVVLLHYAPVQATVEGEPPEVYAWMGSSRLEEPLSRYPIAAVFHGHAHHGAPEGKTHGDAPVPVYNVSLPLMRKVAKDGAPPFRVLELPVESGARTGATAHAA
ncbi:MAG TPA: metallophosphoesterase [Chloroflexota bacterium]|jgi:Icc-related predicted phosphoesterase